MLMVVNKLFYLPVILSYALPTFIYKDLTEYFSNYELIVFYHLVYHFLILGAIVMILFYDKKHVREFITNTGRLPNKLKLLTGSIVILGLISQYAYFQLLRGIDVNSLLTVVRGASTVVVMAVGYFIYKENLSILKILGIFLVLAGILLVNYT